MFDGSPLLRAEMENTVLPVAPETNFIRAEEPPVVGAVLLGMQGFGKPIDLKVRAELIKTLRQVRTNRV